MSGTFLLPDNFNGTRADALRLLADYDEAVPDPSDIACSPERVAQAQRAQTAETREEWARFLAAVGDGKRLRAHLHVYSLGADGETWADECGGAA